MHHAELSTSKYKGTAMVNIQNGSSVLFWHNMWGNRVRHSQSAELYSFTTMKNITLEQAYRMDHLHDIFQLPLSETAFQQYLLLSSKMDSLSLNDENDVWSYIWGNVTFSVNKTYKAITGHTQTHPVFGWLWNSKCQPKHSVILVTIARQTEHQGQTEKEEYASEHIYL
jgi:hypothetical protein